MNPPKCPSCGHEHWQIEGCGPADLVFTSTERLIPMPEPKSVGFFGMAPIREEGAINDDPTRGGIPPEDLVAYDAIHRAETRTDYVNAKYPTGLAAAVGPTVFMVEDGLYVEGERKSEPLNVPIGGTSKDGPVSEMAPIQDFSTWIDELNTREGLVLHRVRKSLKMTQPAFSAQFAIALGTLRGWENGRHKIPPYVMVLLRIIEANPKAVFRALGVKA